MLDAVYEAVEVADSIEEGRRRAYAYSAISILMAPADLTTAAYVASMIGDGFPGALSRARLTLAGEMQKRNQAAAVKELEAVLDIAGRMGDAYERHRTMARAVAMLAPLEPEEAAEYARGEKLPMMPSPGGSEALGEVIASIALAGGEQLEGLMEGAGPLAKARAYADLAESTDGAEEAGGYFHQAMDWASEAGSPALSWEVAVSWSRLDPERISRVMAPLEAVHNFYEARSSLDLALLLHERGEDAHALEAYRLALARAAGIGEPYMRSEAFRDIAARGKGIDRATFTEAYEAAVEAARQLGAGAGEP
jgi:hypothetical protein